MKCKKCGKESMVTMYGMCHNCESKWLSGHDEMAAMMKRLDAEIDLCEKKMKIYSGEKRDNELYRLLRLTWIKTGSHIEMRKVGDEHAR